jgi:SNF2 family DNA or RNA helicase
MEPLPHNGLSGSPAPICNWHFAIDSWQSSLFPQVDFIDLLSPPRVFDLESSIHSLTTDTREVKVAMNPPWVRSLGKPGLEVSTQGWRFPAPIDPDSVQNPKLEIRNPKSVIRNESGFRISNLGSLTRASRPQRRLQPSADTVLLKERLLYLLQPPLENLLAGRQVRLYAPPYPYQLEGIAFLMPRQAALLADEMGLGKTMQAILALRLLFHAGLIHRVLIVCPKSLVSNWARELRQWAEDLPYEVIGGAVDQRRTAWLVSNCPLKLVNYELLTRDEEFAVNPEARFDIVVLDEAQRIKNRESKASRVARAIPRQRSWALTGTPIENRSEDLINLFAFVDQHRVPADTPPRRLPQLTADSVLRRTKEDVLTDLPPKTIRDAYLELTPAQREAYDLAEKEGVIRLNSLGDTITVQHVFELILRLKQICNFDPLTGESAKLEQMRADLAEVADSGRKAIVFSQWVEPLELLAQALKKWGPLLFHGQVPAAKRPAVLEQFCQDPRKHVLLMSYGTGSVGLNLQFANYVFLFDRWWNPAVEDQAINRTHRIGQRNPVFVTRFVTEDTIEGRIAEVLERKRQLFAELIEQNEPPPSLGLSEEEIFGLFEIQARPRRAAA